MRLGPAAIPFRYGRHPAQVVDLHLPADSAAGSAGGGRPVAVAVLVHGGYWRARYGRELQHPVAADLTRRGWAVWNVDYRGVTPGRSDGGGWPGTFQDVAEAIDLLAEAAVEHCLPLHRTGIVGHSAGGALALWAAGRHRLPPGAPGADPLVRPGAVVAQAAICDLVSGARDGLGSGAVVDLMAMPPQQDADRYRLASPSALLPLDLPVLLVTGADDDTVPPSQSTRFASAARAAGDDVTLEVVPGEGHFGHLDPAAPIWHCAVDWLAGRLLPG
jgi:acetyl esterase/lipase